MPSSSNAASQRRIALLAVEQQAWALASRDPRLLVVETRTELDWAMRQGRLAIWAPSKLVLAAVAPPAGDLCHGTELAAWLAAELGARGVLHIGAGPDHAADAAIFHPVDRETLP